MMQYWYTGLDKVTPHGEKIVGPSSIRCGLQVYDIEYGFDQSFDSVDDYIKEMEKNKELNIIRQTSANILRPSIIIERAETKNIYIPLKKDGLYYSVNYLLRA